MATKKKKKAGPKKTYRFQLTLPGMVGIGVVCFCLFLWMFLLGIWAGQTFLLPSSKPGLTRGASGSGAVEKQVETLASSSKKKPTATEKK